VSEADVTAPADVPAHVRAYLVRVTDAYRTHEIDAMVSELLATDIEFVDHRPLGGDPMVGHEAVRSWLNTWFEFMPDFQVQVEVLAHDGGDIYLARDNYTGRGSGAFGPAETEWYVVDRLRDDKLWREDIFADEATARGLFEHLRSGAAR
jgi:hypothetical protein